MTITGAVVDAIAYANAEIDRLRIALNQSQAHHVWHHDRDEQQANLLMERFHQIRELKRRVCALTRQLRAARKP